LQGSATGLLAATVPTKSLSDSPSAGGSRVNTDLNFMSATTLVEAIRTKKISPVEAVDALYKRIHELNPRINDLSVESDGTASGIDSLRIHSRGLPVSIQIVGRRFADAAILQAVAAFERVRPWASKRPPM